MYLLKYEFSITLHKQSINARSSTTSDVTYGLFCFVEDVPYFDGTIPLSRHYLLAFWVEAHTIHWAGNQEYIQNKFFYYNKYILTCAEFELLKVDTFFVIINVCKFFHQSFNNVLASTVFN